MTCSDDDDDDNVDYCGGDNNDNDDDAVVVGNIIHNTTETKQHDDGNNNNANVIEAVVEAELILWMSEPVLDRVKELPDGTVIIMNPLLWWKANENRFKRLSIIARKLLCIHQATSASSERLFSSAGLTIASKRSGLTKDNASMLIFLHENLPLIRSCRNFPEI